jgi:hypothetical protein
LKAIGLRATPNEVYYTVVEKENEGVSLLTTDTIIIPRKALDVPQALTFIRTNLISLLSEYSIEKAGIRVYEGNTQNTDIFRLNLEGVLQELLANSTVQNYFLGRLSTFGKYLGATATEVKDFIKAENELMEIEGWDNYSKEERESIITALVALEI